MDSEDGQIFVKNLAHFVRTHEKALANAIQLRRQASKNGQPGPVADGAVYAQVSNHTSSTAKSSAPSTIASVLSLGALGLQAQHEKAAKLSLTSHHLYYLLCKMEEIGIQVGPMGVRLENIHTEASPANYVSFLNQSHRSKNRSDRDSIHSVSSMRSVMSGMSSLWSGLGLRSSNNAAKIEKAKAQFLTDLKYLYSSFTKIPCLRLSPDHNARLINGYEEFPFDTAVPLLAFKNVSSLEISDVDFRQFYGWDRLAEQLRSLTIKRAHLHDVSEVLSSIVLDDMDKRRRRSSRAHGSPPLLRFPEFARGASVPGSPVIDEHLSQSTSPRRNFRFSGENDRPPVVQRPRNESTSPARPASSSRREGPYRNHRAPASRPKRSSSASSTSSTRSNSVNTGGSSSNLLFVNLLPPSKWSVLKQLSLADNSLTTLTASSLIPVAGTLTSLDLSSNLFNQVPDAISSLTSLKLLNLSNCMIESLRSLTTQTIPSITTLNIRANRLRSLAGIEQIQSIERLDLRDNLINDPVELARLTGSKGLREVWVWRNPFVKLHPNHRIVIFNLFRDTPGFSQDLLIDAAGPGYQERRQLRDRTTEVEQTVTESAATTEDLKRSSHAEEPAEPRQILMESRDINPSDEHFELSPEPQHSFRRVDRGSTRRKRGTRRRIVDLAEGRESSPPSVIAAEPPLRSLTPTPALDEDSVPNSVDVSPPLGDQESVLDPPLVSIEQATPNKNAQISPVEVLSLDSSLAERLQELDRGGDNYRQKLEALKDEVGNNWLSVLGEAGLHENRVSHREIPTVHRTGFTAHEGIALRSPGQRIVGGSRTLG